MREYKDVWELSDDLIKLIDAQPELCTIGGRLCIVNKFHIRENNCTSCIFRDRCFDTRRFVCRRVIPRGHFRWADEVIGD